MLVLARKTKEMIKIGDNITVKVISIRNGQVKLGIEAPKELKVSRASADGHDEARNGGLQNGKDQSGGNGAPMPDGPGSADTEKRES
jgi:carbon storage regulator CsrA